MEREQIPDGWRRLLGVAFDELEEAGIGPAHVTAQIGGRLPDFEMKMRIWKELPPEKLVLVERIAATFNAGVQRTCEVCGSQGERRKMASSRDRILCDEHVKEGDGA